MHIKVYAAKFETPAVFGKIEEF